MRHWPPCQRPRPGTNRSLVAWVSAVVLVVLFYLCFATIFSIVRPVRRLLAATDRLARGENAHVVTSGGIRELDTLTLAFNSMAQQLAVARAGARDAQQRLEAKVEERTRQLQELAEQDPLTGIANRRQLFDALNEALDQARVTGERVGVFFLDIDNFKTLNDSMGHPYGDRVLIAIARRLEAIAQDRGFAARLGGDEFTLVQQGAIDADDILAFGTSIVRAFDTPLQVDDREVIVSVSVGASVYPGSRARCRGAAARRGCRAVPRQGARTQPARDVHTGAAGHRVGQVRDRAATAARHPERRVRTVLSTADQLRDARRGAGRGLDSLAHAGRQLPFAGGIPRGGRGVRPDRRDQRLGAAYRHLHRGALASGSLAQRARRDQRVAASIPGLSIREQARGIAGASTSCPRAASNSNSPSPSCRPVRTPSRPWNSCARSALPSRSDDFGTGYSSLASLQQLPLTRVKLDRSLIAGIDDSARSASIARATIALCRGLGLEVTAEGVERLEQFGDAADASGHLAAGLPVFAPGLRERTTAAARATAGSLP